MDLRAKIALALDVASVVIVMLLHRRYSKLAFDGIAVILLIGAGLVGIGWLVPSRPVFWIGFALSAFSWGLIAFKCHRPVWRALTGKGIAPERFSTVQVLQSAYHVKLEDALGRFIHDRHWQSHDGRFIGALPNYQSEPHTGMRVRFGDVAVAEAAADWDVNWTRFPGWVPLASIEIARESAHARATARDEREPQFLMVRATAPHAIAMWEHETGVLEPVAESLEEFVSDLR